MNTEILVVDPDLDVLARIAGALSVAGFAPTVAASYQDGAAFLKASPFDVVVTAHHLEAHNGLQLVLRARAAGTPKAIVMTATPDPVLDKEAAGLGAVTVVSPWKDIQALIAAVAQPQQPQHAA